MEKIISLCKRRGFVFQSSEIYGGMEALWDFGPLGALLKQNIKNLWLKEFVLKREDIVLIDGTVIMHPKVWEASGHLSHFSDPLVECKNCHLRFRADHLEEGKYIGEGKAKEKNQCPNCGGKNFTKPRQFNLMFKTFFGPVEDSAHVVYLRPETAQSMFVNFKLVQESMRLSLPFGIAQIGKAFRNEITTGNFLFRLREFEIAEIEYFVKPNEADKYFEKWVESWKNFFVKLGIKEKNLRYYEHPKESLAHYAKRTIDIEYNFPFGFSELGGIANRTDFDLKAHSKASGKDLSFFDEKEKKKIYPFVIEPTVGIERLFLAVICEAFEEVKGGREKEGKKEAEIVLHLPFFLSPIKVAVLPLLKNKKELVKKAKEIFNFLKEDFVCFYDEKGSIGRRYRRQDEIGTPLCLTVDFQTLEDNTVTLRERDSMEQIRIEISRLKEAISRIIEGEDFRKFGKPFSS